MSNAGLPILWAAARSPRDTVSSRPMSVLDRLSGLLSPYGLILRGAFHPAPDDGVPQPVSTLAMIGNVGRPEGDATWRAFNTARGRFPGSESLNEWARSVVEPIARRLGAAALFPFGAKPPLPFQRWAMRADRVFPSPLGLLIHPDYGLWHAYRAALGFAEKLPLPPCAQVASPCETCAAKPCLAACPVGAFTGSGYDVPRCVAFLDTPSGADCMERGCRARRACPVGADRVHEPAQAQFHMRAFRRGVR